jgi:hypothetical protein
MKPLNGEKTHPLTDHAIGVLRELRLSPIPRFRLNPGVVNRLLRESLVEHVWASNDKSRNVTKEIEYIRITDAGRSRIKQ